MSNKRKITESEASTSSADSSIEIKRRKTEDSIIPDVSTSDASNSSIDVLRTELTQEFKDFGIDGESAQYDVGKEEVEEIKKWAPQQVNEFLEKKSEELFLIKEDLDTIKTNRIAGQDFLLLTKEELMRYGLKGGPATRIALLVEKLKDEEQGASHLRSEVEKQGFNRSYAVLKNAFKNTLIKPREDYVDVFFRHLEQCASIWTPQQFYAPYTSLIQASGTGKSRLLIELAFEKDVFVVYICLRDSESRGYPKRSIIADVLTGKAFPEAHYHNFLSALFGVCSEFFDQQLRKNAENICGRVFDIFISDKDDEMFELQNTFWNNVSEQMELQQTSNKSVFIVVGELESRYKDLMITLKNLRNPWRALQAIPHGGDACFMALFTDTLSKVSDFSPAKRHDPSARVGQGERLYKPFYLLDVFDCRMQRPANITVSSSIAQIRNMGRPLWADVDEGAIIQYAMEKILCDREKARNIYEANHKAVIEKVTEALAILGPRLYLEISNLSQQASELVSSHMRILRHVDETRESLATTSSSEPVLAEAASHIMNCSGILVQVLDHLVSSIRNHVVVNAGDQGELVGRILCLLAIDKAIQSKSKQSESKIWNMYSQPITIQEFFDALVGSESCKKLSPIFAIKANGVMLRNSKVRFNHFAYVEFTPTRVDLINFFFRGAAVFCKRNQKGVDIIIPVAMVRDDETPITEKDVTFVGIQVRNREADGPTGDEDQQEGSTQSFKRQKMDNIFKQTACYIGIDDCKPFPLPYLGIYMSLGVTFEGIEYNSTLDIGVTTRTDSKDRMGHLSIYGLSKNVYACFNDADGDIIESLLHKLLISYVDPVEKENGILGADIKQVMNGFNGVRRL